MRLFVMLLLAAVVSACTSFKVAPIDEKTGHLPSSSKAAVIMSKPMDLDSRKALLLVPNSDFVKGQVSNLKYFDDTMTFEELEKRIVQAGLQDQVPTIHDRIGVNKAAKHYKDFLWLRYERKGEGRVKSGRFILTDPATMEDYFITETTLDYAFAGVNDQNNWYPMFNALIDYIRQNSKFYKG